jgi:hypothetical protein
LKTFRWLRLQTPDTSSLSPNRFRRSTALYGENCIRQRQAAPLRRPMWGRQWGFRLPRGIWVASLTESFRSCLNSPETLSDYRRGATQSRCSAIPRSDLLGHSNQIFRMLLGSLEQSVDHAYGAECGDLPGESHARFSSARSQFHRPLPSCWIGCLHNSILNAVMFHSWL